MTQGKVMKRPPSLRPGLEDGELSEVYVCAFVMTCLQGASLVAMTLGKKLPTSASMGSIFSLSMKPVGVGGFKQGADSVSYGVERVCLEGEVHATLGAELVHEDAGARVAFDVFEEEGGASGLEAVAAEFRGAVSDLGHFQNGIDFVLDYFEFACFVELFDPFA